MQDTGLPLIKGMGMEQAMYDAHLQCYNTQHPPFLRARMAALAGKIQRTHPGTHPKQSTEDTYRSTR